MSFSLPVLRPCSSFSHRSSLVILQLFGSQSAPHAPRHIASQGPNSSRMAPGPVKLTSWSLAVDIGNAGWQAFFAPGSIEADASIAPSPSNGKYPMTTGTGWEALSLMSEGFALILSSWLPYAHCESIISCRASSTRSSTMYLKRSCKGTSKAASCLAVKASSPRQAASSGM